MEASSEYPDVIKGDGYAIGTLGALGQGPGFRKVRKGLEVTAFGVNAIVMPAGYESGLHAHERQEELYFVHRGTLEIEFADGSVQPLAEGSFARVDAPVMRKLRNVGDGDAIYVCVGGKDGYVGRDGLIPESEQRGPIAAARRGGGGGGGERA
jgi:mannose-6-phosphate isomerase-like protein (cupin superfamily)